MCMFESNTICRNMKLTRIIIEEVVRNDIKNILTFHYKFQFSTIMKREGVRMHYEFFRALRFQIIFYELIIEISFFVNKLQNHLLDDSNLFITKTYLQKKSYEIYQN